MKLLKEIPQIIIDPGHGGLDKKGNYTTYPNKMYDFGNGKIAYEGLINRQFSQHFSDILFMYGLNVNFTVKPEDSTDLSLKKRVEFCNKIDNAIIVSLHSNASKEHNAKGWEIYTTKGFSESDLIAQEIAMSVKNNFNDQSVRKRFNTLDGDLDKEAQFFILRKTKHPAVLIENMFFDNTEDYEKLFNPYFVKKLAYSEAIGLINYIYNKYLC